MVVPITEERLLKRRKLAEDPDFEFDEPLDYMKFLLDSPDAFDPSLKTNPVPLARAYIMVNASAFHATGLTLANLLLDVFSADLNVAEELRGEDVAVQAEHGARLSFPVLGRHRDESLYPNPDQYDAFKFSRVRLQQHDKVGNEIKVKAAVTTDAENLSLGLGKSVCPGRFFAVDLLKGIAAHILIHYEVQHFSERPANIVISSQCKTTPKGDEKS
ncbi:cytochrome P450 monooxygenase gloP [Colletotrichum spaethianum]|uniref:Cytochrome P450 monooxygenase gloP n=1 Tax=Colletotrichum spaethianum TaxID=700344 RepID=A0AA37PDB7_9PEZI|nr:cytochrome P450 monooxygenase gloP [Colletotrichum spaethianum]GKT50143.1 cytochrome P450 monooxygenase gloP [Colletotrichum spaethianum]